MMSTELLFRTNTYLAETPAKIIALTPDHGIVLDQTVFYAQGGGQPGDVGQIVLGDGTSIAISHAAYSGDKHSIVHIAASPLPPLMLGCEVTAQLDWAVRHKRMRIHTALHLLSVVLPYPVTGGSIGEGEGRLDFDIPDAGGIDKEDAQAKLNDLIQLDRAVTARWITDAELDASPHLVKTMMVKPPRGSGQIRLVEIDGLDLQPCGGTHVARTGEIGRIVISKVEKKGRLNRRVRIELVP